MAFVNKSLNTTSRYFVLEILKSVHSCTSVFLFFPDPVSPNPVYTSETEEDSLSTDDEDMRWGAYKRLAIEGERPKKKRKGSGPVLPKNALMQLNELKQGTHNICPTHL